MSDEQNVSRQTAPTGTDGGIARRALVLPEGLPWTTPAALHHIAEKRLHQIVVRDYTPQHDDGHSPLVWADLLGALAENVAFTARSAAVPSPVGYRAALVDLAAVATAAIEAQDRIAAAALRTALTEPKDTGAPDGDRPSDSEPPAAA